MNRRYLFDASSIIKAFKEAKIALLGTQAIQELTIYEVLNVLWKEVYLLHRLNFKEASSLIDDFSELIEEMTILSIRGIEQQIFQIAMSKGITVYDASYIALAKKYNLVLVTEDKKLSSIANRDIEVVSLESIS